MKLILLSTVGKCVMFQWAFDFMELARTFGYNTVFLGCSTPVPKILQAIKIQQPDIVVISHHMPEEDIGPVIDELSKSLSDESGLKPVFIFGGDASSSRAAENSGIFQRIFSGDESPLEISDFLRERRDDKAGQPFPGNLVERIRFRYPFPLLHHHLGLPDLVETEMAAHALAASEILDVLTLVQDQNAQEHFFHPKDMQPSKTELTGTPLRTPEHMEEIYEISRCGNYPLLRAYSSTRDLVRWAELQEKCLKTAWGAIPLTWYSKLDGRSKRPLQEAIKENLKAIKWYAEREIPVSVNEVHHWSMREAHDALAVAVAYIAAYNAKEVGVKYFVAPLMFNTPSGTSFSMDLAKMMAMIDLIEELHGKDFTTFRQVRPGVGHYLPDVSVAKGQMAASATIAMYIKPNIFHVISSSEAHRPATVSEIVESCRIIQGVMEDCMRGLPDVTKDKLIHRRKTQLISDARLIIKAIESISNAEKPLADPATLVKAIEKGILDAPKLQGRPPGRGKLFTRMLHGACVPADPETGDAITEEERLDRLGILKKIKL
ncbi:MAG: methionine synthase [Chloroflexi bacterium]|nr:methionine synthase [Chloroflexota bacterium]